MSLTGLLRSIYFMALSGRSEIRSQMKFAELQTPMAQLKGKQLYEVTSRKVCRRVLFLLPP